MRSVVAPGGDRAATVQAGTLTLWSAETGEPLARLAVGLRRSAPFLFSGDGSVLAAESSPGVLTSWSAETGAVVAELDARDSRIMRVALSHEGAKVATWTDNLPSGPEAARFDPADYVSRARLWDLGSGSVTAELGADNQGPLVFSPDGTLLASSPARGPVQLWNVATSEIGLEVGEAALYSRLAFDADHRRIAAASDGVVSVWSTATGERLLTVSHQNEQVVRVVAFDRSGDHLATGGSDGTLRVWSLPSGEPVASIAHESAVRFAAFDPTGRRLLTMTDRGVTQVHPVHIDDLLSLGESRLPVTMTRERRDSVHRALGIS